MPRLRDEGPLALSGPLSAPPGSSPFSPNKADHELRAASARVTRPVAPTPATAAPTALDLPLASFTPPQPLDPSPSPRPLVFVALLIALLLPTATHAPWSLLDQPSGPTFLALMGLMLLAGLDAGPPHLVRWGLRLVAAVTLAALSGLALTDTLTSAPWGENLGPHHGALLVLGFALLVGGALTPSPLPAARVATASGAAMLLLAGLLPGSSGIPIAEVMSALFAPRAADLAASIATMVFMAAVLATAASGLLASPAARSASFAEQEGRPGQAPNALGRGGFASLATHRRLALIAWLLAPTPLLLHVLLSTPADAWMLTLAPLKATLVVAGALLLCADAIAPALGPEQPLA